jgi:hypothetical protein
MLVQSPLPRPKVKESKKGHLVLKNYSAKENDSLDLYNSAWSQKSLMDFKNRLWLPIYLSYPSRSSLAYYNDDNFLAEVYWFKKYDQEIPAYYWIESKNGIVTTNYLPIALSKMLSIFKDFYGRPSTKGVVFTQNLGHFSFQDLHGNHSWRIHEDKIQRVTLDGKIETYLFKGNPLELKGKDYTVPDKPFEKV